MSAVRSSLEMCSFGVDSSQTVCQMPKDTCPKSVCVPRAVRTGTFLTTARRIPDHSASVQGLLSDWYLNIIHICRVKGIYQSAFSSALFSIPEWVNLQLIRPVHVQIRRHIYTKLKVSTSMETSFLAIDKDGGFIINSAKVQNDTVVTGPRRGHFTCDPYLSHLGSVSTVPSRKPERTDLKEHSRDRRGLEQDSRVSVQTEAMRLIHWWYFYNPKHH